MTAFAPWKIVHVDLAGVAPLASPPGYRGVEALFWLDGVPLGHAELSADQLPMTAREVLDVALPAVAPAVSRYLFRADFGPAPPTFEERAPRPPGSADLAALLGIDRPLARLRAEWTRWAGAAARPAVSVVVCTRDRPESLARCLDSIRRSSRRPEEILVVDNAPTSDATRDLVRGRPGVGYVREPRPGLSVARNTGIARSVGEIVAFTDDDVVVHADWVARLQEGFADPGVMVVTGLVLPAELETESQWIFEKSFGGFGQGYRPLVFDRRFLERTQRHGPPVWRIGAGANMAFRRAVFARLGDFDPRLGAGAAGCSEDSEYWYRVLAADGVCRYEPAAVVFHYHRAEPSALRYQTRQYLRGHAAALVIQFARYGDRGNLRRLLVILPRHYLGRVTREILGHFRFPPPLLRDEVLGWLSGMAFLPAYRRPSPPRAGGKAPRRAFLARNPFPRRLTLGFFYREKMRAIHRIAPDEPFEDVLEIGGGRGGLTALLYPRSRVTVVDRDPAYAGAPCNRQPRVRFECADATALPFPDGAFDAVTMFDVLEHIADDHRAVGEAVRVLRPGGWLLVSAPNERWRFPYYRLLGGICPTEAEMLAAWGHLRRGYAGADLAALISLASAGQATFITPLTVLGHDVAFSRLPEPVRRLLCVFLGPLTWLGYALHAPAGRGTETASAWRKRR